MRASRLLLGLTALLAVTGCRSVEIPPPPGAGTLTGTVMFTSPGHDKAPAGGATFRLYVPTDAALAAAPALAAKSGATLVHSSFSDDLTGPLAAQRAFALAFAADLKNWRLAVDCRRR